MTMDWQIALVSVGFCVLSGLVVYLISVFGMKEKTYEEAIEEQRRRNQEALLTTKTEKPKKKFKKASSKKGKEKSAEEIEQSSAQILQDVPAIPAHNSHILGERVDFKTETEIIPSESDPEQSGKTTSSKGSKKKSKGGSGGSVSSIPQQPPKSILVNKQEVSNTPTPPPEDHEDEDYSMSEPPAPMFVPKDEVERRHSQDAGTLKRMSVQLLGSSLIPVELINGPQQESKKKEETVKPVEQVHQQIAKIVKEEPQLVATAFTTSSAAASVNNNNNSTSSPAKKNKKNNKSDQEIVVNESERPPNGKKLLSWLKSAQLQDDEIQLLIDVLLNKQHEGAAEWTKRNDPVTALKKQLQEREATLEAEQRQTAAVNAKLRELRHELSQEKSRSANGERTIKEKLSQHQQEAQALHARFQHAQEQHLTENATLQAKLQQLQSKGSDEQNIALQRLSEENSKLQQKLSRFDSERQNWTSVESQLQMQLKQMQSVCEQYEGAQLAMQQENEKLETRIQQSMSQSQEDEYKFGQRMSEMGQKMAESEGRYSSLVQEAQRAKSVAAASDVDRAGLTGRLEQTEMAARKLEIEVNQLKEALEKEKGICLEIQCRAENVSAQFVAAGGQLAEANRQTTTLIEENNRLKADLIKSHQQNGDIGNEENIQKELLLKQNAQQQDYTKILNVKENEMKGLEESLQRQKSFLATITEDLEGQKKKNNELREKNWKAMEALTAAEKSLKEETAKREEKEEELSTRLQEANKDVQNKMNIAAQQAASDLSARVQEEQRREKEQLAGLLPDVKFDNTLEHKKWLDQFVTNTRQKLTIVSVTAPTPPSSPSLSGSDAENKLTHLRAENSSLKVQIQHYQTVLAETEDILKKLQSGVEAEELKWKDKLSTTEERLTKALDEKKKLEKNLEELQGIEEVTSEMQSRLKELQSKLQGEENEKKNLEQKFDQATKSSDELNRQLDEKNVELQTLRKDKEDSLKAKKELSDVRETLEKERKITKDLSSQTIKLSSLIKIGQDALKAEQDLVKELQSQNDFQRANNNGNDVSPNRKNGDLTGSPNGRQSSSSNGSPASLALNQSDGASGKK